MTKLLGKVFPIALIIIGIILIALQIQAEDKFVGNKRSHKYHYSDCVMIKRMSLRNKVYFNDYKEALRKGYIPCLVCKPPREVR